MLREWTWVGLVIAVLGWGYLAPRPRPPSLPADSFSAEAAGKKAFFDVLRRLFPDVRRSTEQLVPPETGHTLVLLGPARYPNEREWRRLHDWVSAGGGLLFAARASDPAVDLGPFGARIVPGGPERAEEEPTEPGPASAAPATSLVRGSIEWPLLAHVVSTSGAAEAHLSIGGSAQVLRKPIGQGVLVIAASDFAFTNGGLGRGDNGVLGVRILELTRPTGPLSFDESLNASGPPKLVGVLFDPPLRLLTVQALLVAVLFGWSSSRRFGPPLPGEEPPRRSLREHALALGHLHHRADSGSRIVTAYLEFLRLDGKLSRRASQAAAILAGKAREEPAAVARLLERAERAGSDPHLDTARAASLVKALAGLKRKARGAKGVSDGA